MFWGCRMSQLRAKAGDELRLRVRDQRGRAMSQLRGGHGGERANGGAGKAHHLIILHGGVWPPDP